jgi:DNA repair protein RadA/Sms
MARAQSQFACQECGAVYMRWQGRCDACSSWNKIIEEAPFAVVPKGLSAEGLSGSAGGGRTAGRGSGRGKSKAIEFTGLRELPEPQARLATGLAEFDRVLGGGLVAGSVVLIGGDPGIGKSTLMLQVASAMAAKGRPSIYISGEEAVAQLGMRAHRLGLSPEPLRLAAAANLREILGGLSTQRLQNGVVVIDSIQTVFIDNLDSAPGTVTQVRSSAQELVRYAKRADTAVLMVGHVTKDGQIAGPRVVEHMVDTVLYFEGERGHRFRILRAVKNRFGATDEIGVFDMTQRGLIEVANPSLLFLGEREHPVSGTAVFAGIEGSRPLLVEIQALVAASTQATPRRAVVGWDSARLAMLLAVLDARCGLGFGGSEVYLNVAGGMRIQEPAADLAVAAALISASADRPISGGVVAFGEVSLAGEVRPVPQAELRLKEAAKLGFRRAFVPAGQKASIRGIEIVELKHLSDLLVQFPGVASRPSRSKSSSLDQE